MKEFALILAKSRDLIRSWNGELIFVYLPGAERARLKTLDGNLFNRDSVLSLVNHLEIPIIDLAPIVAKHKDPMSHFPFRFARGHYNADGYRLLSETIFSQIRARLKNLN